MLSGFGKACTCVHNPPHISTLATQWQVPRDILGEGGGVHPSRGDFSEGGETGCSTLPRRSRVRLSAK